MIGEVWELVSSEWGTEQEKARQQVQAVAEAAFPLVSYDPIALIIFMVYELEKTPYGVSPCENHNGDH